MTELSAGSLLTTSARMFGRTLPRLLPVVLVLHAPFAFLVLNAHLKTDYLEQLKAVRRAHNLSLLVFVVDIPLAAIISHAVVSDLRGAREPVLASTWAGLRHTLPAIAATSLVAIPVSATMFVVMRVLSVPAFIDTRGILSWVLVAALVALSIALYVRWFVLIPAIVVERPGIAGAFSRSAGLTHGQRFRIAAITITIGGLFFALYLGLIAVMSTGWDSDNPWYWYQSALQWPWMATGGVILYVCFNVVQATVCATTYHALHERAEARRPDRLSRVFD